MNSIGYELFLRNFKRISYCGLGLFMMLSSSANAVVINFDELDQSLYLRPGEDEAIAPLTNEYESLGMVFVDSAYLVTYQEWGTPVSLPNYVAGPGFGIKFVGSELPTYVSFYLGSDSHAAVEIDVTGPNYRSSVVSSGGIHGMTDYLGTPYIPNEVFSFYSPTGISLIDFSGQSGNYIDNITYTYAKDVVVPEPSALILFGFGLLGLISSRFKFNVKK